MFYPKLKCWFVTLIFFLFLIQTINAKEPDAKSVVSQVREYRSKNEAKILNELVELLSIPNVAGDKANIQKNTEHLMSMLRGRGVRSNWRL